jgi:hypothetical protein
MDCKVTITGSILNNQSADIELITPLVNKKPWFHAVKEPLIWRVTIEVYMVGWHAHHTHHVVYFPVYGLFQLRPDFRLPGLGMITSRVSFYSG